MATYAIHSIRVDANGRRISHVKWQEVDPAHNTPLGPEEVVDVAQVVQALDASDTVIGLFLVEGLTIPGARAKKSSKKGVPEIVSANAYRHIGRTLIDLPRF